MELQMLKKAAANPLEMDRLIRAQVLEGALGARFNSYRGDWRRIFRDAKAKIPGLDPQWVQLENTGLWQALLFGIRGPLKSSPVRVPESDEDIAMSFLTGINAEGVVNPKGSGIYQAGVTAREQIEAGKVRPTSFINRVKFVGMRRALDALNRAKTEYKNLGREIRQVPTDDDDRSVEPSSLDSVQSGDRRDVLFNLLFDDQSRAGKLFRQWLTTGNFGRPGEIVQQMIDSGADSNREAAAALGISEASVSNALKVVVQRASTMPMPPALDRELDLVMETQQLGYRGIQASGRYMVISDLPEAAQQALKGLGYHKRDIEVRPATHYDMIAPSGEGSRGFACAVNLATGQSKTVYGDWGGANMFSQRAPDLDDRQRPLTEGNVVIKGSSGNYMYAYMLVNPANLQDLLPAPEGAGLSTNEKITLKILNNLKSGYRGEYMARYKLGPYKATNPIFQALIQKGMVTARADGAMTITTKGRNVTKEGAWEFWQPGYSAPPEE